MSFELSKIKYEYEENFVAYKQILNIYVWKKNGFLLFIIVSVYDCDVFAAVFWRSKFNDKISLVKFFFIL